MSAALLKRQNRSDEEVRAAAAQSKTKAQWEKSKAEGRQVVVVQL